MDKTKLTLVCIFLNFLHITYCSQEDAKNTLNSKESASSNDFDKFVSPKKEEFKTEDIKEDIKNVDLVLTDNYKNIHNDKEPNEDLNSNILKENNSDKLDVQNDNPQNDKIKIRRKRTFHKKCGHCGGGGGGGGFQITPMVISVPIVKPYFPQTCHNCNQHYQRPPPPPCNPCYQPPPRQPVCRNCYSQPPCDTCQGGGGGGGGGGSYSYSQASASASSSSYGR